MVRWICEKCSVQVRVGGLSPHTTPSREMCEMLVRRRMPSWDAYNRFALVLLVCEQVDTSDKENKDQCYQGFACGEKGEVCLRLPAAV